MSCLKILVVDDIPINRKLLAAQLEPEGYIVVTASNGVEALEVLDREHIDVIISDILMPTMDGYRLCYEVRRSEPFRNTPFIFYSSTYTSPTDEKLSLDLGGDKYVAKPASVEDLLAAIVEVCAKPGRKPTIAMDGMNVLKEYSERLVSKLEEKNIELTEAVAQLSLQTTALETASDAILITDREGTILWVNHAFTTMTGYDRQEAVGATPRILNSGVHDAQFYRQFWETIRGGRVWHGEFTNRRKDGSLCFDEHTVTPVLNGEGKITHFVGVLHDITERKRANTELREAHEQLRQLLEHSPAVIYALKVEGETVTPRLASENITQLLGFTVPETMSYEWWLERLHPEDRERATASVPETLRRGVSRIEYRLRHKDGSYRWVDDQRRLVRNARGEPAELVGVWTDITERRQAQDELRASERRFSDMLRNLQLAAVMLDRDANIMYCNDYLLRLTGWRQEEVAGRNWFDLFIPADLVAERTRVFSALLSDDPELSYPESEILTRAGQRRLIHWNNSVLRSISDTIIGVACIGEDVTERKAFESQLLRTQRVESLGTLAGGIAHDLNNLFMPILMGTTLLKRFEQPERARKAIENIERCVSRGTNLVKQVLSFARGVEGSRIPLTVSSIFDEVQAIATSTFPKNITLATSVAGGLPMLMGDPTQLVQVVLNLCVNARDASPGGGLIALSADIAEIGEDYARLHGGAGGGRFVVLFVTDNGTGMPQRIMDRIFEPFFTTKAVGQGTGLGLSTARGIVRSHGGFMTVSSEVGKGSVFKVYIPEHSGHLAPAVQDEELEAPKGSGELILLVDDEKAILDIARQTLEASGYEVLTAEDGAQAIELYVQHRSKVALVLTDMMMPILDGATLIAALRRINPEVRVIAASGREDVYGGASMKAGAHRFLVKPFTTAVMLNALYDVLHGTPSQEPGAE